MANNLIDAIDEERVKRELSDRQFSLQVLGISPSLWCRLKNGERALTLDRLQDFQERLPEITPKVATFFLTQGNDHTSQKVKEKDEESSLGGTSEGQERA